MAKQNTPAVKFSKSDAPRPKRLPGGFIGLRAPFPMTIKPQSTMNVDFSMSCDNHILLIGTRLEIIGNSVVPAGHNIKVHVRNPSLTEDVVFDVGEPILLANPVFPSEYSIE